MLEPRAISSEPKKVVIYTKHQHFLPQTTFKTCYLGLCVGERSMGANGRRWVPEPRPRLQLGIAFAIVLAVTICMAALLALFD
jgi:hypothetical protein